jgi:putative ABC transport system ATP-binding protein
MQAFRPTLSVSCRRLVKTFAGADGPVHALRGVDFSVREGELVMVVGPSGCGKTTLISIIAALLGHENGTCEVLGEDLSQLDGGEKALMRRDRMGFVFQSYNLIPTISITENAAVPLLLAGVPRRIALSRSADMLERLGLGQKLKAFPNQLSGGQQQRAAIARAIVHEPSLVICDEPTSALDHATGVQVMQLLGEVARGTGKSLVIVTHDSRIFSFADRIVEMDDGRAVALGIQRSGISRPEGAL